MPKPPNWALRWTVGFAAIASLLTNPTLPANAAQGGGPADVAHDKAEAPISMVSGSPDSSASAVLPSSLSYGGQSNPSCELADGSACPSSYFSGPLGDSNILPAGSHDFLIDQYGAIGTGWDQSKVEIDARERQMGRKFSSIQIMANADPSKGNERREQWILDSGHQFVTVAWNPTYDLRSVAEGRDDSLLVAAAKYWAGYKPARIMIRMFTEFNLNSQVLSSGGCGADFQAAWRHVVDVFKANGASNVGFWYVPAEGNHMDCVINSYPGDQYVDWVGSDSYNWCRVGDEGCWSTPLHAGAARFGELFRYGGMKCPNGICAPSIMDIFGPRKPFVVGETETIFDAANSSWKPVFVKSIAEDAPLMRYLKGVSIYDFDVSATEGKEHNFKIMTSQDFVLLGALRFVGSSMIFDLRQT